MKQHCEQPAIVERAVMGVQAVYWVRCECGMRGGNKSTEGDAVRVWDNLMAEVLV